MRRPIGCFTRPADSPGATTNSPARRWPARRAGGSAAGHRREPFLRPARRLDAGGRRRICAAIALGGAARISVHRLGIRGYVSRPARRRSIPISHSNELRFGLNYRFNGDAASSDDNGITAPALGYRQFRHPRPDHFAGAICTAVPFALCRDQQPDCRTRAARPGTPRLSRHAAVDRRRIVDRPGDRSGLRARRHARRRRIFQRRSLQGRRIGALCRACRALSSGRPSISAAKPRKSKPTSTNSAARRPRTGWCSRSANSASPTYSTTTNTPTIRASIS